jgi:hypothetical protein
VFQSHHLTCHSYLFRMSSFGSYCNVICILIFPPYTLSPLMFLQLACSRLFYCIIILGLCSVKMCALLLEVSLPLLACNWLSCCCEAFQ